MAGNHVIEPTVRLKGPYSVSHVMPHPGKTEDVERAPNIHPGFK
jgi:hypothetical protein